jgi:hypothetical protein
MNISVFEIDKCKLSLPTQSGRGPDVQLKTKFESGWIKNRIELLECKSANLPLEDSKATEDDKDYWCWLHKKIECH